MIPVFIRSVAAQVRALVESKRAVHVTEADAVELEMIAGLWAGQDPIRDAAQGRAIEYSRVTPNDFAYAWLWLSRVREPRDRSGWEPTPEVEMDRAAVCAELGIIACQQWPMHAAPTPDDLTDRNFVRALAYGMKIDPHAGTIEGARAAWEAVVQGLSGDVRPVALSAPPDGRTVIAMTDGTLRPNEQARLDKYRRELEGMR